jgi:hypothetical protein
MTLTDVESGNRNAEVAGMDEIESIGSTSSHRPDRLEHVMSGAACGKFTHLREY